MDIEDQPRTGESRLSIGVAMLLVAGATVGIWLALGELRSRNIGGSPDDYFANVILVFFGLLLGLVWACTGLYLISLFYRQDILGK